jgi:hypothetical protein
MFFKFNCRPCLQFANIIIAFLRVCSDQRLQKQMCIRWKRMTSNTLTDARTDFPATDYNQTSLLPIYILKKIRSCSTVSDFVLFIFHKHVKLRTCRAVEKPEMPTVDVGKMVSCSSNHTTSYMHAYKRTYFHGIHILCTHTHTHTVRFITSLPYMGGGNEFRVKIF